MKIANSKQAGGFNFLDLMIVVITVIMLVVFGLAWFAKAKPRSAPLHCVNYLKQVGLAFRMWANDNGGMFPMAVSTNNSGSMEYNRTGQVFRHYQALSKELYTPKFLVCPNDAKRSRATNWAAGFNDKNISYFVGLDAEDANPFMILSGDRNITGGIVTTSKIMLFTTNSPASWTKQIHGGYGNIGLADGSVQQVAEAGLRKQLQLISNSPIRLAIP